MPFSDTERTCGGGCGFAAGVAEVLAAPAAFSEAAAAETAEVHSTCLPVQEETSADAAVMV